MQKSVLVQYLKAFSPRDWRELRKLVQSPFHNQRQDVLQLLDYLEKPIRQTRPALLDKDRVFAALFPKQTFTEATLRYTMSFLLQMIKQYLIQSELEQQPPQQQLLLARALRQRGMDKYAERELRSAQKVLDQKAWRHGYYHFQRYQIAQEELSLTLLQKRSGLANFQSVSEELTLAYIADLLRHSCSLLMQRSMSTTAHSLQLREAALQLIDQSNYQEVPAIAVYWRIYQALYHQEREEMAASEEAFENAKALLEQHWTRFPQHEIREIYLFTINYCIRRLNNGERRFIREAFELFRSGLEKKTLLNRGYLSSFSFKNITRLGMALGEYEWVQHFLTHYKKQLHPRERDNTWRYNLAFFYFQQPDYARAMPLLQQVELKDTLNNLDARRMLLRSYYELGEYDALESLLDSFSTYIYRQKDIGYHRENYINLIRFVKKMIDLQTGSREEWDRLGQEVLQTSQVAEKEWLLRQLIP